MASKCDKLLDKSDISYASQILGKMNDFRKEGVLCDVTIVVQGGRQYVAHRTVLAASSHYFRTLFTFNSKLEASFDVQLEWLYPEAMDFILEYIYTGKIKLRPDIAGVILTTAAYLFIEGLPEVVVQFLQEHLNLLSCFSILSLADEHSLDALKSSCSRFIRANFVQASSCPAFLHLQKNLLEEVISTDDLVVASEGDVFHAIVRWISHDLENRACHFTELFSCIQLQDIPRDVLINTVAREALFQRNSTCTALVQEALNSALGREGDVLTDLTKRSLTERVDAVVICGGNSGKYVIQSLKKVACFVPSGEKWFDLPDMPRGQTGHASAVCNGVLYSTGNDSCNCRVVQCYDTDVNTWGLRASMPVGRRYAAAVAFHGQVYVLGGFLHKADCKCVSSDVSRYNPAVDKWYPVSSMNCAREGLCAVVLDGSIFAIGGCDPDDNYLSTVEKYEPQHDLWTKVSPMFKKRAFASAAVVNNKILVIGGRESKHDSSILGSCELFDPVTGQWSLQPGELITARCAAGACAVGDKVFVFGGESEDDALDTVECWNAEERQWSIVTHMPFSAFHVQAEILCLPKNLFVK